MKPRKLPRGVFERKPGEYWICYFDQYGRKHREKVGPYIKQAVAAYQKRKSEVREGRFFPQKRSGQVSCLFADAARDFLAHSKRTKRSYGHDQSRMQTLLQLWRDCSLADLTPGRIERGLAERGEQEEWTPATYNRHRALASALFSLAVRNGKAQLNPVRATRYRTENNVRVRYLTDEEEQRLLDYLRCTRPEREAEVLVVLHSGMRRSEQYVTPDCPAGGLKRSYIDFRAGVITLPRTKHGESRHIAMNSVLRKTLKRLVESDKSEYVFPMKPPDEWFPEACQQANICDFTWHCFRHTFASRLVMARVDLRTVQELMGHKSILTTMRYAHLTPGHQAAAVELLVTPTDTATDTRASELAGDELAVEV